MIRTFAFGIGLITEAISIGFSIVGMIALVIGAGIALALCSAVVMGIISVVGFFLALLG